MFETGIRDTRVWITFLSQANEFFGRFQITGEGDLSWLGPEFEGAGHDLLELTIDSKLYLYGDDTRMMG